MPNPIYHDPETGHAWEYHRDRDVHVCTACTASTFDPNAYPDRCAALDARTWYAGLTDTDRRELWRKADDGDEGAREALADADALRPEMTR